MDIKNLIDIFSKHEIESIKIHKESLENFIANNPGKEPPDSLKDDFNFPKALKLICKEIVDIKEKLGIK